MGVVHEGDMLMWRRFRNDAIDEEILRMMYSNYGLVVRLISVMPTYARSFQANMDSIAAMDRLVTVQQDLVEELLQQEPDDIGDSSDYDE